MKKYTLLLALLLGLMSLVPACAEEPASQPSQWTVMFYFCGSDLESQHSFASGNIAEIRKCLTYDSVGGLLSGRQTGRNSSTDVNVVLETGGSSQWHTESLGMDVKTNALQRWHLRPGEDLMDEAGAEFELQQELPLASMADPQTLSDFIRWSAENYPAEKYLLVIWDHGMGAVKGLCIDELFDDDTMRLDELKTALSNGGVHFEAVLFDACLMASLETAYAIKDSANWMIASEELVAGKGTAMNGWLQQMFLVPEWDGQRLGRWICEMNMYKYAQQESDQAQKTITWSVIDLSKIERVAAAFDRFFEVFSQIYANGEQEYDMLAVCEALNLSFEFGTGEEEMIDLANLPYSPGIILSMDRDTYVELLDSLTQAVVYNTHAPERATAGGLSFWYANGTSPEKLDAYAKVSPSAHYLALLDAINPNWEAPDWVFEQAEKLPEIVDLPQYQIKVEKTIASDGSPQITVTDGYRNLRNAYVDVLRLNPQTGNTVYLGDTSAVRTVDEAAKQVTFSLEGFFMWPAIEDTYCAAQLVDMDYLGNRWLFQIPMQMGGENYMLRVGLEDGKEPVVYGLWEGYDTDSSVFSRNVIPLSKVAGREYSLLYPIDGLDSNRTRYELSEPLTLYRSLEIEYKRLEPGTYYIDYYVEDIFQRLLPVERVEIQWDGEKITVPEESDWAGSMTLTVVAN